MRCQERFCVRGLTVENKCVPVWIENHRQYLEILDRVRKDTALIVLVQIDGADEEDPIVKTAKQMMLLEKQETVDHWLGTIAPGRGAARYVFRKHRSFFGYLATFESFFLVKSIDPLVVETTDFGMDDIAFLDQNGELLFYTTTHEGYANLHCKYVE